MATSSTTSPGSYRWRIAALLFMATTINYLDRQVIGLLKPLLEKEFNWTESDYSNIIIWFQASYALGLLLIGNWIDRVGTRIGYTWSVIVWSLAAMAHALSRSTLGFSVARAVLGIGEAGNFPAAIKTVAEWFPKKERALATGIFNSGANIGAIVAPATVPWLALEFGWQVAFIATGAIGFIWLIFWWRMYDVPEKHPRLAAAEKAHILSDDDGEPVNPQPVSWWVVLKKRATWGFFVGKFMTDPIWWFYLFWLPSYLNNYGLSLSKLGLPLIFIYSMTTVGSIGGGWLSSRLIQRGWSITRARKTAMFIFALCVVPVMFIPFSTSLYLNVFIISIAAAAHAAWSANIYTTASDQFPKRAVSTVIGIGGMAGAVGGILFAKAVGLVLDYYKGIGQLDTGYNVLFVFCGLAYVAAFLIFHMISPRLKPVDLP